jgi:hypothetical protein
LLLEYFAQVSANLNGDRHVAERRHGTRRGTLSFRPLSFCEGAVQSRPGTGTNEIGESMAKKELLEDAIKRIVRRAGLRKEGAFHLTLVSSGTDGIYIMDTIWPEGPEIYRAINRVVGRFPAQAYTTCIALLPDMVDEIIAAGSAVAPVLTFEWSRDAAGGSPPDEDSPEQALHARPRQG